MRVLQLGPYPPPHGGVQSNLVAIRNFLLRKQIPCAVINITRHRKAEAEEVYYPKNSMALLRLLFQLKYDIIHLHIGGMLTTRLLGLSLVCCLMPGRKSVLTFHSGGYPSTPQGRRSRPASLTGFVFRRFDRLIGVNPAIVEFFRKLGVPANRTRLIYPHSFSGDVSEPASLPENLADFFKTHRPTLISVGLLEPEYDLPIQIDVLGKVRQKFPSAGLVMVGSGSLESELRSRISVQPYASHMLLCGDVPHHITLQAISSSDVMLRTTLYDGDAVSVREALHLGVPVIATDNGMRPQGVRLVPVQNADALCDAIEEVANAHVQKSTGAAQADETNIEAVFHLYEEITNEG
jgi:glycosyltransferase involved in cell wall biosynthesis